MPINIKLTALALVVTVTGCSGPPGEGLHTTQPMVQADDTAAPHTATTMGADPPGAPSGPQQPQNLAAGSGSEPDEGTARAPEPMAAAGVGEGPSGASMATGAQSPASRDALQQTAPPCISQGSQVALIGDSYITGFMSPPLQPELDALLMAEGLAHGYPNYAVAGAAMAAGGIGDGVLIPRQFDEARAAHEDIRLVIMNGGGNDWLLPAAGQPACSQMPGAQEDARCRAIVEGAVAATTALMDHMAERGVRDILFFGLPHFRPGGLGGSHPNEVIDMAHPLDREACDNAFARTGTLRCHYIDLRDFHDVADFSHVMPDGSHPSLSAQQNLAQQIVTIMNEQCLGQSPDADCCITPPTP